MRREGFELTVSRPHVVFKIDEDGKKLEPIEEVIVDAGAAKGQSQPILVHSKNTSKSKSDKTSAA